MRVDSNIDAPGIAVNDPMVASEVVNESMKRLPNGKVL